MRLDFYYEEEPLVSIREAVPNDALGIYEVLKTAFLNLNVDNYSEKALTAAIIKPWMIKERIISNQLVLVASIDDFIVGTISGKIQHMSMKVESFAVHPEFQKQGVGRQLLRAVEDIANENGCYKIYLFTTWLMKDASKLYYALKYEKEGYLRNQYYGEDLVIFGKCLEKAGELSWNISE